LAVVRRNGVRANTFFPERKFTAKPSKLKWAKVLPDGRVQITDPQTGKKIIKPPGWSPIKLGVGALVVGNAVIVISSRI
jgi:predicted HAD superfamily Cof-like phosphohydrolase